MEIKEWLIDWFYIILGIVLVIIPIILLGTLIGFLMHPVIGLIVFICFVAQISERFQAK